MPAPRRWTGLDRCQPPFRATEGHEKWPATLLSGDDRSRQGALALAFAESAQRRARGVADAVEPFHIGEAAAPHPEAHQLRDHVAVRVVVAGARRALVVDRLARCHE